jgi:hypothetical protein
MRHVLQLLLKSASNLDLSSKQGPLSSSVTLPGGLTDGWLHFRLFSLSIPKRLAQGHEINAPSSVNIHERSGNVLGNIAHLSSA